MKMCRCCQNCWEDFYWNCFEERFCYDESIANYNPDDDDDYILSQKNGNILGRIQPSENNNLTVPTVISDQPLRRGNSMILSNGKIHEEDYRRETQTNVPMLGPEILAVFANSQIFQDHQPTKMMRISTKAFLAPIHTPNRDMPTTPKESEQDRLLRRLEANLDGDTIDAINNNKTQKPIATISEWVDLIPEKRITFTLASDSSPDGSHLSISSKKFDIIAEEDNESLTSPITTTPQTIRNDVASDNEEVVLRPRLINRHRHLLQNNSAVSRSPSGNAGYNSPQKKTLRYAKSVPHFNLRSMYASETDIFSITGSTGQISMTPEVPSISFSNLPKNYEDTPTIEKYRVSQSLYSIQTANAAKATKHDYSMPRYFRRSATISQSSEMLAGISLASSMNSSTNEMRRPEKEKSKRLQMLRGNLPPLLIHSVSFRKNRDEAKQVD